MQVHAVQFGPTCVGALQIHGSTSYTAQDPWIQNCSLQDNVLMGLPMDSERYEEVLKACALLPDLELLPAGDQTEIGETGCESDWVSVVCLCVCLSVAVIVGLPSGTDCSHGYMRKTCIGFSTSVGWS